MRILTSINEPWLSGGAPVSHVELVQGLEARGHDIHVVYERAGGAFLERYRASCRSLIPAAPLRLHDGGRRALLRLGRSALASALRVPHPEVIHANDFDDLMFGFFQATILRRPLVCHLRTEPRAHQPLDLRALSRVARFLAVSHDVRRNFEAAGLDGSLIDVVHNGVDPKLYRAAGRHARSLTRAELGIPGDARLFVYAGRLGPEKGFTTLIEAFARVRSAVPDAWLAVLPVQPSDIGPGSESALASHRLRRRLSAIGVSGSYRWLAPTDQIGRIFAAADTVVLPSVWREPCARVVIEALACGCPVIGTNVGGTPELLHGPLQPLLVRPADPEALAAKMRAVVDWRTSWPALGKLCRNQVLRSFTLDRTLAGVEATLFAARNQAGVT